MTNTVRLNDEIKKSGLKKGWIAAGLGLSHYGFQRKINNKSQFKAGEIKRLCQLLDITALEMKDEIFFADNVDNMTTFEAEKGEMDVECNKRRQRNNKGGYLMYNEIMDVAVKKLEELFPDTEIVTNPLGEGLEKPYFEVGISEASEKPVNGMRYFRSISMFIKYRPQNSERPSSDINLVLEVLMDKLECISLADGSLIRSSSRGGRNEGGILNFLVVYQVYISKTWERQESMEDMRIK